MGEFSLPCALNTKHGYGDRLCAALREFHRANLSLDDINKDLGKGSLGREPLEIKLSWEELGR